MPPVRCHLVRQDRFALVHVMKTGLRFVVPDSRFYVLFMTAFGVYHLLSVDSVSPLIASYTTLTLIDILCIIDLDHSCFLELL